MRAASVPILLLDGVSGEPRDAILTRGIGEPHLDDFERTWRPWLERFLARKPSVRQESRGWDWRKKVNSITSLLAYPSFAVESDGETQGLMIVNLTRYCELPAQRSQPLVYVEFLETAPWNRSTLVATPRFKRVGNILIYTAVDLSLKEGFDGRIGLHSLPQSGAWYRDKCGMSDLGIDTRKEDLR